MLWDVFISHAGEDTAEVARPLQQMLEKSGLRVWLDETQLELGDSLREKIDEGLAQSRFGLVILSQAFFAKRKLWTKRELEALLAKEVPGRKTVLPVWHNLTQQEVSQISPLLADRVAVSTSSGLDKVVQSVLRVAGQHLDLTQRNVEGRYASEFNFPMNYLARSIEVIESLSNEHTWKHLAIVNKEYPYLSWMGTDSPALIDVLYDLTAPLIEFHQMRYGIRRSLYVFHARARLQFCLLEAALQLLFNELDLAGVPPPISYTPRVPDWRELRKKNPQRYWWQGIERERFEQAIPFFLKPEIDTEGAFALKTVQEFRGTYQQLYDSGNKRNQQAIGLLANALYGFSPKERPVYWRLSICLTRIYQVLLGNTQFNPETMGATEVEKVFLPNRTNTFPFNFKPDDSVFFESYDTTFQATTQ